MTETADFDLDAVADEAALGRSLAGLAKADSPVVTVRASIREWDRVVTALCRLRAENWAPILLLRRGEIGLDEEEATRIFSWLRLWDQFLVHNFLAACGDWVPTEMVGKLEAEAKMELMWVREYWSALGDERIHRYPPLPWRRFLRKLNDENYAFVSKFLEITARPSTSANQEALKAHCDAFLAAKKKVVSLFPKRWNRLSGDHDV